MNAQLRIIGSFNATTLPPVVTSTRLDTLLRQRIREALLSIHQDTFYGQRLRESSIERFFPVTNEHYQLVAQRYKKAQALIAASLKLSIYALAPRYYDWVHIHTGIIPKGLAGNELIVQKTRYYLFQNVHEKPGIQEVIYQEKSF